MTFARLNLLSSPPSSQLIANVWKIFSSLQQLRWEAQHRASHLCPLPSYHRSCARTHNRQPTKKYSWYLKAKTPQLAALHPQDSAQPIQPLAFLLVGRKQLGPSHPSEVVQVLEPIFNLQRSGLGPQLRTHRAVHWQPLQRQRRCRRLQQDQCSTLVRRQASLLASSLLLYLQLRFQLRLLQFHRLNRNSLSHKRRLRRHARTAANNPLILEVTGTMSWSWPARWHQGQAVLRMGH